MRDGSISELRRDAMSALKNLEQHSPNWVAIIRKYIRFLERWKGGRQ